MAGDDKELLEAFARIANASNGVVKFESITTRDLSERLGLELPGGRNRLYFFTVSPKGQASFHCVGYNNVIDSDKRPSTRADALGKGIAAAGEKLFDLNPFELIYDYSKHRFMAVSAILLFETFAKSAAQEKLEVPGYGFFSITPHFENRTINMYGDVPPAAIQYFTLAGKENKLDGSGLVQLLGRFQAETERNRANVPTVLASLRARIKPGPGDLSSDEKARGGRGNSLLLPVDFSGIELDSLADYLPPKPSGDRSVIKIAVECLSRGSHVILYGPPGTGKTTLATALANAITGNQSLIATATADWSSFETLGGYAPSPDRPGELSFSPGLFLRCFESADATLGASPRWLVLDEINRADIDKIFGPVFGVLAGQSSSLPFLHNGQSVRVVPESAAEGDPEVGTFVVPRNWRLIATMNTHDKASLFQLSYAFMRRFAWIYVGLPDLGEFLASRSSGTRPERLRLIERVWEKCNVARELGPSIWADVLKHVAVVETSEEVLWRARLLEGMSVFVAPQFEGTDAPSKETMLEDIENLLNEDLREDAGKQLEESFISFRHLVLEVF